MSERLYIWGVTLVPNNQKVIVVASSIESAIALAVQRSSGSKAIAAERGNPVDFVEEKQIKEHPYR